MFGDTVEAVDVLQGIPPEITISAPAKVNRKPKRTNTCNHWQIDKLYNMGAIDQDQHYAGVHIRYWRECAIASHLKALSIETVRGGASGDVDGINVNRLDAKSLMSKIIIAVKNREMAETKLLWAPAVWVAIDDLTMSHAAAKLGMRKSAGLERVLYSLTALYEELERSELLFWQRSVL